MTGPPELKLADFFGVSPLGSSDFEALVSDPGACPSVGLTTLFLDLGESASVLALQPII